MFQRHVAIYKATIFWEVEDGYRYTEVTTTAKSIEEATRKMRTMHKPDVQILSVEDTGKTIDFI